MPWTLVAVHCEVADRFSTRQLHLPVRSRVLHAVLAFRRTLRWTRRRAAVRTDGDRADKPGPARLTRVYLCNLFILYFVE